MEDAKHLMLKMLNTYLIMLNSFQNRSLQMLSRTVMLDSFHSDPISSC